MTHSFPTRRSSELRTLEGTVLGFPRDAWVEIPGRGAGKINTALTFGGPQLLAETVRNLTGLPVHYYVLTGRSEEHTSELQSLMRISYAVFCLKKKKTRIRQIQQQTAK